MCVGYSIISPLVNVTFLNPAFARTGNSITFLVFRKNHPYPFLMNRRAVLSILVCSQSSSVNSDTGFISYNSANPIVEPASISGKTGLDAEHIRTSPRYLVALLLTSIVLSPATIKSAKGCLTIRALNLSCCCGLYLLLSVCISKRHWFVV